MTPAEILAAPVHQANTAELQVYLNAVCNGLARLSRTTSLNNSPAEISGIAEHCQRNFALAMQILTAQLEAENAQRKGI